MPKYDPAISAANAAVRADLYAKEAARQLKNGNAKSASEWQALADQAKAKSTVKPPKPSTPTAYSASTPKPSTSSSAPQKTSGIDWTMNPPENATQEAMRQNDMAIKKANEDTVKKADDKVNANAIKGHMKTMEDNDKRIAETKKGFETSDKIKDLKGEVADNRKVEQNWKDKAAKATTPEQKEHALQMAGEYADKARKREGEIAELEKGSKVDIPKISNADKKEKTPKTDPDPMEKLIADIPTMNNSSAYNTGGAGAGSGVAGFFTRDGKVIPITA